MFLPLRDGPPGKSVVINNIIAAVFIVIGFVDVFVWSTFYFYNNNASKTCS